MEFVGQWRGFHHVALVTPNLDDTISFYQGVLGMQVDNMLSTPGRPRHCFVKPGATESWGAARF